MASNPSSPFPSPRLVAIDRVRFDAGTQSRLGGHDPQTVKRYAEAMQSGLWEFERSPLPLLFFDGDDYYPGDGHHRLQAALLCGLAEIQCDVRPGSRREAQFYSNTEANKYHGKQLTRQDKRNRVRNLLLDQEWTLMSDREIARHCGVSAPFVGTVREGLVAKAQISGDRKRKGKDGKIRDTTNIGRVKPEPIAAASFSSVEEPFSGRTQELEQALAEDEALMQQIYDGLGTIRAALDPDRPAQELRQDVVQAARGIDLMRQILAAQAPNLVQDDLLQG
jgi:hypothetical protein